MQKTLSVSLIIWSSIMVAGCGSTTPPPDFSDSWKPLNAYSKNIQEIPLSRPYRFTSLPIDRTFKGLLERWALDAGAQIDYRHNVDYSLSYKVSEIDEVQLEDAVMRLDSLYSGYGVSVQMNGKYKIIVTGLSTGLSEEPLAELEEQKLTIEKAGPR